MYITKVPPYDDENAFSLLVKRVEAQISKENTNWSAQIRSSKKKIMNLNNSD